MPADGILAAQHPGEDETEGRLTDRRGRSAALPEEVEAMKALRRLVVVTLSVAAMPALAGIADSPLPVLTTGATTYHLYSVPGVIRSGGISTLFSCTSTDTAAMQAGVEVFSSGGGAPINDPVATSLTVAPGATVTFGMGAAVGISVSGTLGSGPISKGSARILATSRKLVCTAFLADDSNAPPTSMAHLTIIAKTKQKAAN